MEDIIAPIDKKVLKSELTEDKRLRFTNKSNNEIYIVTWKNAPNVLKEIGRLREIAFRAAGGGTGKSMDLDEYDLMENPYQQLIVWDPEAEEILGGYRYLLGDEVEFDADCRPSPRPEMVRRVVDLPAPLAPIRVTILPSGTSRLMPRSALMPP